MIPGKRYRGWGWVNDYKEFCFEAEKTGSNAGKIKEICVRDGVHVKESKRLIMFSFNIEKSTRPEHIKELARLFNTASKILNEYEI